MSGAESELGEWLRATGHPAERLEPMTGDVSARRYLRARLGGGGTAVVVLYPPQLADACGRFLTTGELLASAGVRVPRVLAADCGCGRMLVEDLGAATLFDRRELHGAGIEGYLEHAATIAGTVATLPREAVASLNPPLDAALLGGELEMTAREALAPHGLLGPPALASRLEDSFHLLASRLGEPPLVPCHRDFMVRNLMPSGEPPGLAVLDHQDLRLGPPLYDLASLLEDSIEPGEPLRNRLLRRHAATPALRLAYHRAAAQRTLKAAGTFARFARLGNSRHLGLIPATLGRALANLRCLPEFADLASRLEALWRPAIAGGPAGAC